MSHHGLARLVLWLALGMAWVVLCCGPLIQRVHANDFDNFQRARTAYEAGRYSRAAKLFDNLVGEEVPQLQNRSLVLESLKYLGASQLFLGETDHAERQFERLLELDLNYVLDPLAFPEEVQRVFRRVKKRLEQAAVAQAKEEAEARDKQLAEQQRWQRLQTERNQELLKLATTERVEIRYSRLTALVPFGVGQFQNGDSTLGWTLAVAQGLLLATAVTTYLLHDSLRAGRPEDLGEARFAERAYRYANQASASLLGLLMVGGIVDAQVRFRPGRTLERERPLPPELLPQETPRVSVSATGLRVRF